MPTCKAICFLRGAAMVLVVPIIFGGMAGAQTARLMKYRANISFSSAHQAAVVASFDLQNSGKGAALTVRFFHYPGQRVESASIKSSAPGSSSAAFQEGPDSFVAKLGEAAPGASAANATASYQVTYEVESDSLLRRVPLPVPEAIPVSRQRPVTLDVSLPAGYMLAGDSFPMLTFQTPTRGSARLLAVPSLLQIQSAPANAGSLGDRVLNPATLTTLAMLLLLASGSIVWYRRSRLA